MQDARTEVEDALSDQLAALKQRRDTDVADAEYPAKPSESGRAGGR
jgi:hypothetical protein